MDISDERLEPVFSALKEGNLEDVKNLLAPLEISGRSQLCFVMLATEEEQVDIVKFFLQNDFIYTCDALKESEQTPLHIAVEKENLEIIEMLLETMRRAKDMLKAFTPFRARLMHLVISKGNKSVLELLLNYHDPYIAVQKILGPFKPIHLAVENGYSDIVQLLLQGGVSVNYRYPTADGAYVGCTILHRAVQLNYTALCELLLESGADVSAEWGSVSTVFPEAPETEIALQDEESVTHGIADSDAESTGDQSEKESDEQQTAENVPNSSPISFSQLLLESGTNVDAGREKVEGGTESTLQDEESVMHGTTDSDIESTPNISERSGGKQTAENASNSKPISFPQLLLERGTNVAAEQESVEAAGTKSTLQDEESGMHGTTDSDIESTADISEKSDGKQTAENASNSISFSQPSFGVRDTPLHVAIKNGNERLVKLLLEYNANVDAQESQGKTVLQLAVEKGCPKIVTHVLNYCPDVDHAGNRAAFYISQLKDDEIATELRSYFTCFYQDNPENYELLYNAVRTNYFKLAQKLVKHGTNVRGMYEGRSVRFKGRTLLHVAAANGTGQLIKLLIDSGADTDAKNTEDESPLLVAIQNSNLDAARQLFPATKSSVRNEPELFITALERGCPEIVELCIQNGADINKWVKYPLRSAGFLSFDDMVHKFIAGKKNKVKEPDDEIWQCLVAWRRRRPIIGLATKKVKAQKFVKTSPLCIAAMAGFPKVVQTLLKYSPKILFVEFHFAVLFDRRDVVQVLLDKEAEFDSFMKNFGTFVWCAEAGHVEMLELLIKSGANIDQIRETDGKSGLHTAASLGNVEIMKLLLKYGAEVDVKGDNNLTPLFTAVETYSHHESHDRLLTVKELLKFGASIECENSEGRSVLLSAAVLTNQPEPLQTILEYGSVDIQYVSPGTIRGVLEGLKKVSNDWNHPLFYKDTIQTADILIFHVIKMKAAGFYPKEEHFEPKDFHVDNAKMEDFWCKCSAEIAEMKLECVGETDVTFYDILTQNLANIACFAKHCGLSQIINSEYCKNKFPIYGGLLKNQFEKGEVRKQLLERGAHVCLSLCSCSLTYEIVEKILSHLSSRDLRTVIQAGNPQENLES